jgi:hypothetical protein
LQLMCMICRLQKHACIKNNKDNFFGKILLGNKKLQNKTFFVFGSTCRIFVSAEYSADNFRPNTRPKTFSVDHFSRCSLLACGGGGILGGSTTRCRVGAAMFTISVPIFAINGAQGRGSSIVPTLSPGRRTLGRGGGLGVSHLDLPFFLIVFILSVATSSRFT